ncbi:uncharacterized protein DS421_9g260850 [Arachis hypogaea]|nr:uncharacterized protein DS421_9g260850 [Arachis hypogaea]
MVESNVSRSSDESAVKCHMLNQDELAPIMSNAKRRVLGVGHENEVIVEEGFIGLSVFIGQMTEWVIPAFQHEESFVKDNKDELLYINGNVKKFPPLDLDLVNYFDLKKIFEELGYHAYKKMYWYDPTTPSYEAGLHPIYGDKKIREMCDKKREDKETDELCLFFDHPIMEDVAFEDSDDTDEHSEAEVLSDEPISDNDSYNSYESTEDEAYKLPPPEFEDDTDDSYDSFEDE